MNKSEIENLINVITSEPKPRLLLVTNYAWILIEDEDTLKIGKKLFEKFQRDFDQHSNVNVERLS